MKAIWKYPLEIVDGPQPFKMPCDARILHVGMQRRGVPGMLDHPTMWALVETTNENTTRFFRIVGTGHFLPRDLPLDYIGTAVGDALVWHVMEEIAGN